MTKENTRTAVEIVMAALVVAALWSGFSKDRQHEAKIEEQASIIQAMESGGTAIIVADNQGLITRWPPQAVDLYGYTYDEMIGQPVEKLMRSKNFQKHRLQLLAAIAEGTTQTTAIYCTAQKKTGEPVTMRILTWVAGNRVFSLHDDLDRIIKLSPLGILSGGF